MFRPATVNSAIQTAGERVHPVIGGGTPMSRIGRIFADQERVGRIILRQNDFERCEPSALRVLVGMLIAES
jgi:hypothetical protein